MGCFLDTNVLLYAVSTTPAEASKRQLARYCPVSIRMTGGADGHLEALHRAAQRWCRAASRPLLASGCAEDMADALGVGPAGGNGTGSR